MRSSKHLLICVLIAAIISLITMAPRQARADTANPSTGSAGYETIVLHASGAYTSTVTPIKFKAPWPMRVLSISVHARSVSNNSGVASQTADVKQGTTSLLAAPVQIVNSDTVYSGTLATTPTIPDESTVSVILNMTGTNPSTSDLTVTLGVKRQ